MGLISLPGARVCWCVFVRKRMRKGEKQKSREEEYVRVCMCVRMLLVCFWACVISCVLASVYPQLRETIRKRRTK